MRAIRDEARSRRHRVHEDLIRKRELAAGVERNAGRVHTIGRGGAPVEGDRPRLDPLLAHERCDRAVPRAEDLERDEMGMAQAQADRRSSALRREGARHLEDGERRLLELLPLGRRERHRRRGQEHDHDDRRAPALHLCLRGKYFFTYARYFDAGTNAYTCVRPTRYMRSESATTGEY